MKIRPLLVLVAVLACAGVCVRLGFWQLSRWHEKQALNAATRMALAAPAIELETAPPPFDSLPGRRVRLRGRYDPARQVLLSGRSRNGAPGVEVVTPLRLSSGNTAVLVNRGWLYAGDARTARAQDHEEPGERLVLGLAEPIRRGAGGPPVTVLGEESVTLYSARWLDLDSLAQRFPYEFAPFVVRELPGEGVPVKPARAAPRPLDESIHLSYAVQWFLFAAITLVGSAVLASSRRRHGDRLVRRATPD